MIAALLVALAGAAYLTVRGWDRAEPGRPFAADIAAGPGAAEGDRIAIESLRGRVVVLDFWASWCAPCRQSVPILNRVANSYHEEDIAFVGINTETDLDRGAVRTAYADLGPVFPTVHDRDGAIATVYGIQSLPTLVILDRAGDVAEVHVGVPDEAWLNRRISGLLE